MIGTIRNINGKGHFVRYLLKDDVIIYTFKHAVILRYSFSSEVTLPDKVTVQKRTGSDKKKSVVQLTSFETKW